jgi:hypothetical protein
MLIDLKSLSIEKLNELIEKGERFYVIDMDDEGVVGEEYSINSIWSKETS